MENNNNIRILCISDTHNKHGLIEKKFGKMPDADIIIHSGDITSMGTEYEVKEFFNWFSSLKQYKYHVLTVGNHDFLFEENPKLAKSLVPDNVIYLNDSGVEIEGLKIWGSPVQPRFFDWAFNRDRGENIKKHWDLIPNDTDVLIRHGPPKGFGDYIFHKHEYAGCDELLLAVHRVKPKLMVFGHIHEGYGEYRIFDETIGINASVLDGHYHMKNEPVLINL